MVMPTKLDPFDNSFSPLKANLLAQASKLAYESGLSIEKACKDFGFEKARYIQNKDTSTEGFVASSNDFIVVAFRGTQEWQDWLTDARFVKTEGKLGECHSGFHKAYQSIEEDLKSAIDYCRKEVNHPLFVKNNLLSKLDKRVQPQSIWFTGHSLGAAIATIAVGQRIVKSLPVDGLYTFGSPRVYDWDASIKFDQALGNKAFRFVNNVDIVTRVPQRIMGYRHVGQLKYFNKDGVLKNDPAWWSRFLDQMQGRFDDFMEEGLAAVKDHDINDYISRSAKACNNCS